MAPARSLAELTRISRPDPGRRLRGHFVIERFLDLVQAPRASRSQAVNEVGIGFVTRRTFGVANGHFVKRLEILPFDERVVDRHLRERKSSRRRIAKLA